MQPGTLQGFKLSPQQRLLWLRGHQPFKRTRAQLKVSGPLDLRVLRRACELVAGRHEALRTTFYRRAGMRLPLQVVGEKASVGWVEEDARATGGNSSISENMDETMGLTVRVTRVGDVDHEVELSVPALCADAASLRNVISELAQYCMVTNGEHELPEPMQYADYADWQNELFEAGDEEALAGKAFWRRQHLIPAAGVKLPNEVCADSSGQFTPGKITTQIDGSALARLVSETVKQGCTVESYLLGCWTALLWKLCGRQEVVIRERVSGRKYAELKSAIGLFEKWLPVRTKIDGATRLHELIEQIEASRLAVAEWQDYYPCEADGDDDVAAESPIGFSYDEEQDEGQVGVAQSALAAIVPVRFTIVQEDCAGEFRIRLSCFRGDDSLRFEIHYDASALARPDAERMASQFEMLLTNALHNSEALVADVSLLREDERQHLLRDFNRTETPFPRAETIHHLFEEQVERTPQRVAVISERAQLSYAELNAKANRLARFLRRKGVAEGVCVGVCFEPSANALVAMLGVLKAGGAYVPLSLEAPGERLLRQLSETQSPVFLTQPNLLTRVPETSAGAVCLDRDEALYDFESAEDLRLSCEPGSPAYVIYTSGSTGVPKGVAVTHRNLVNYSTFICREFGFSEASAEVGLNFATVSSIAADLGHTVVFPSLITGGCLHALSNNVATDPQLFASYVEQYPIDVLKIVPSHLNALLSAPEGAQLLPRRQLFLGGEAFPRELLETLVTIGPNCEVINHYGPTEATVGALINRLGLLKDSGKDDALEDLKKGSLATVPIGRPIANAEAYVLDENLQLAPVGVTGELYLGGEGLALGYLRQPAQTAEKFVPHLHSSRPGARLYRTGDLVRHLRNDKIEFVGRADNQVKINGYRVELGEVVAALRQHLAVKEAVVMLREDAGGPKRLVAYAVCAPSVVLNAGDLCAHLRERLPEYMVPSEYVFLERLPLTENGKVDWRALPASSTRARMKYKIAPKTNAERTLLAIWQDLLRVKEIGVNDNFFELGGDSILSIQIVAKARQAGLRLLPKQIFSAQTIAELAAVAVEDVAPSADAVQGPVTGSVPLTPIQRWFFDQQMQNRHHFNQAVLLSVPPDLATAHLRTALRHLLGHHDALRSRFSCEASGWRQRLEQPGNEVPFAEVDLSSVPDNEGRAAIEAEAEKWQSSLNICDGPLLRIVLMRLGDGRDGRLLLIAHHLIIDGVSWRILINDLESAYKQTHNGEASSLPAKTLSFKQWAEHLSEYARSESLAAEVPYWLKTLRRDEHGPLAYAPGWNNGAGAKTTTVSLNAEETEALLRAAPRAYRTEIADILLTALVRATRKWNRRRTLLVELEGHGREEFLGGLDVTRTIGWFTTHYPVRLELEEDEEPVTSLKRVKEILRAVPQRGLGFGLLEWMRGDESLAEELRRSAPTDVKFNYLGQLDAVLAPASLFKVAPESSGTTQDESSARRHLFEVNAAVVGGRMHLRWRFSAHVHSPESVQRLIESYMAELRGLIQHCRSAVIRGFTPSEFPAAQLDQRELDSFIGALAVGAGENAAARLEDIEDIYRLSPMQDGLLFHGLLDPESDVYFRQLSCALEGELNEAAYSRAWQTVINHHPALRTSFHWIGLKAPLQVVGRRVELALAQHDWRAFPADEQAARLDMLIQEESSRGFTLSQAPLMRLTLVRLGETTRHLIWSYHHLLMDGWAKHCVISEILECYQTFCRRQEIALKESRPYRDYVMWLQRQDMPQAEAYWRGKLRGFNTPTPVWGKTEVERLGTRSLYDRKRILLSEQATSALQQLARGNQLTLNTVVQGAWGIFLSRISKQSDVVFGAVVSGRPTELEGSEKMIGLFVNTLPVRMQVHAGEEVLPWLKQLQQDQIEMQQFEYSPLVMVQNCSGVQRGISLFDSLLVFENYPIETRSSTEQDAALRLSNFNIVEYSTFPLTLMVGPGKELSLLFLYDSRRFDTATIDGFLDKLGAIMDCLAQARSGTKLQEIHERLDEVENYGQLQKDKELKELHVKKLKSVRRKVVHGGAVAAVDEAV